MKKMPNVEIYIRPRLRQRLIAILMELVLLYLPLIELDPTEAITSTIVISIMAYTIIVSILPMYMMFTKRYFLFDAYPLKLALRLQDKGKLTRKAREDLVTYGVVFEQDNEGWYVVDYDAPTFTRH